MSIFRKGAVRATIAAAGIALAAAVLAAPAAPAQANQEVKAPAAAPAAAGRRNGRVGVRETICADSLYFRSAPHDGAFDGNMWHPQTFLVEGPKVGNYVYGFAYGQINRRGWVADGWFCL